MIDEDLDEVASGIVFLREDESWSDTQLQYNIGAALQYERNHKLQAAPTEALAVEQLSTRAAIAESRVAQLEAGCVIQLPRVARCLRCQARAQEVEELQHAPDCVMYKPPPFAEPPYEPPPPQPPAPDEPPLIPAEPEPTRESVPPEPMVVVGP